MRRKIRRFRSSAAAVFLIAAAAGFVLFGFANPPKGQLKDILGKVAGIDKLLAEKPAVTTSLSDAAAEIPFLDDFNPGSFEALTRLPRTPEGGFVLERPGAFARTLRSYCLQAGTYRPSRGKGYLHADLAGPRADFIKLVAQRSTSHPEIPQRDVQQLIWALLSWTSISDLDSRLQAEALILLGRDSLKILGKDARSRVGRALRELALEKAPEPLRTILEAEWKLRDLLTSASAAYEDLERIAVRDGDPGWGEGSREIPEGRWSYQPDGYFIRYWPRDYTRLRVEIVVPRPWTVERDFSGRIMAADDGAGYRVEAEYDAAAGPAATGGENAIKAWPFRTLRLIRVWPAGEPFAFRDVVSIDGKGWALIGIPSSKEAEWGTTPFAEADELADRQRAAFDMNKRFAAIAGSGRVATDSEYERVFNLAQFAVAVQSVLKANLAPGQEWAADYVSGLKEAWQYEWTRLTRPMEVMLSPSLPGSFFALGPPAVGWGFDFCVQPSPGPKFDPSGGAGVPGNTNLQRLLPSGTPGDDGDDEPDDDPCKMSVSGATGGATVNGAPATSGATVSGSLSISVPDGGRLELTGKDGTRIIILGGTDVNTSTECSGGKPDKSIIDILKGKVLSTVGKVFSGGGMIYSGPTAWVGVRGTELSVEVVESAGKVMTVVEVIEGSVRVLRKRDGREFILKAGERGEYD